MLAGARWAPAAIKPTHDLTASSQEHAAMDLDGQFQRCFGTADLAAITPELLTGGTERMQVDFSLEQDAGRRFALWAML